ncbi:MAG: SUMF1/EgtB/PvdO family nonheme iron enzyme [Gemmataceae bacterium]
MATKQMWSRIGAPLAPDQPRMQDTVADSSVGQPRAGMPTTLKALLNGIVAEPVEETRWLVLADWLDENDDPRRGELLRLHRNLLATCCEPGKHPQRAVWRARLVELLGRGVLPCVPQRKVILPDRVSMTFSFIPAGTFWMGSNHKDASARIKPAHTVTLTRSFFMGVHPVTQEQWRSVMNMPASGTGSINSGWNSGSPPDWELSSWQNGRRWDDQGRDFSHFKGATLPMEQVTARDAEEFCRRLTTYLNGTATVQLPTEAQWEFACRAGTTTHYQKYQTGDSDLALKKAGWYMANSGARTHPVRHMTPNAWGLYDLHGNVWEWCRDTHSAYTTEHVIDPIRTDRGADRICRGGAWNSPADACLAAARETRRTDDISSDLGFRVVLVLPA